MVYDWEKGVVEKHEVLWWRRKRKEVAEGKREGYQILEVAAGGVARYKVFNRETCLQTSSTQFAWVLNALINQKSYKRFRILPKKWLKMLPFFIGSIYFSNAGNIWDNNVQIWDLWDYVIFCGKIRWRNWTARSSRGNLFYQTANLLITVWFF